MILWLGEAAGLPAPIVLTAKRAALAADRTMPSMSAAIREVIPFRIVETFLKSSGSRSR